MAIRHYFRGYEQFEIEAENKHDAVERGKLFVNKQFDYVHGGNFDLDDVICIKKLKPSKSKQ